MAVGGGKKQIFRREPKGKGGLGFNEKGNGMPSQPKNKPETIRLVHKSLDRAGVLGSFLYQRGGKGVTWAN